MNELIESGDPRAKVVGKRRKVDSSVEGLVERIDAHQENFIALWGHLPFRRGVYRFTEQEDFEAWKKKMMIRNSPARR